MKKIIIDTNVIVSALIGSSYPRQILYNLVFEKKVIICLSTDVFKEYIEVLSREKFRKYPEFVAKDFTFSQYEGIKIVSPEQLINLEFKV